MIYFDNAATTAPLSDEISFDFGNPSSPHGLGISTERALISARKEMAGIFSCRESEIVFTSGGTEANNLALTGYALANRRQGIRVFAAPWEHPSVVEPLRFAGELGFCEPVFSPPNVWANAGLAATAKNPLSAAKRENFLFGKEAHAPHNGEILQACADEAQTENLPHSHRNGVFGSCLVVSISQVSHETGDIFDVAAIAAAVKKANPRAVVHVDGVQGFCKENLDFSNIDMYSFSGHKIHGAAGVGGIFVRSGIRLVPILHGGGQENGIRAGTENVRGILQTTSAAVRLHAEREKNHAHVSAIKRELSALTELLPNVHENSLGTTSPYILNLSFLGIKGETLVHLLSEKKIYASMGAACKSRKKQKSSLELMGFTKERAESAVRFSFSHLNTVDEATAAREIIIDCVSQMRRVLGGRK